MPAAATQDPSRPEGCLGLIYTTLSDVSCAPRFQRPALCPLLTRLQVTNKDGQRDSQWKEFRRALAVTRPHVLYYFLYAAGCILFIVNAAKGSFRWGVDVAAAAFVMVVDPKGWYAHWCAVHLLCGTGGMRVC